MAPVSYQLKKWQGDFGKKYTNRNALTLSALEKLYKDRYGSTRTEMNRMFLGKMDRSIRILEVGCNIGNQLQLLQKLGFDNLYGIEPQTYAVEVSKKSAKNLNIINGSAFDLPFKDGYFDLVFTSGVLIHINPRDVKKALKEICRCSNKYIWGFEYYSPGYRKVEYRGDAELLWKADFAKEYSKAVPNLKIIRQEYFNYIGEGNTDAMFLIKK
jgi:pseudaminic acid biosynthesis-associated methylase